MPAIVTFSQINLLTAAPTAADTPATFPLIAHNFFGWLWTIVGEINFNTSAFATPLTPLPHPPADADPAFAALADVDLASLAELVVQVNGMIDELSLACPHVSALPTAPSRGSDPTGFGATAATFLAALTPFQAQMNAYIDALNGFDTVGFGRLLLSGDMQSGADLILLSGDAQVSGADNLMLSGSY